MKSKSTFLYLSILLLVLMIGVPTAQAQFRDLDEGNQEEVVRTLPTGGTTVLRVEVDFPTFDLTGSPGGGGSFYVAGDIFNEGESSDNGDAPIGRFHCWGWQVSTAVGPVFVLQEWNIFGVGKFQLQGAEDGGPRAVIGGTDGFRKVKGEATGFEFSEDGASFEATFKLSGV